MTLIPHRTVASQVAQVLRVEIAKGTWRGWLPGERVLCETVQASRNTLRAALAQLRAEGVVAPSVGICYWRKGAGCGCTRGGNFTK